MPSTMTAERALPSLVRRVALAGAVQAALAGALAAVVGGVAAGRLIGAAEDDELRRAALDYAEELDEELREDEDDDAPSDRLHFLHVHGARTLENIATHELEEVKVPAPSSAVWRGETLLAGDVRLVPSEVDGCAWGPATVEHPDARRSCTVALGDDRVVLAADARAWRERQGILVWSVIVGTVVGAALGGLGNLWAARWAINPLDRLREAVRRIDTARPSAVGLSEVGSHEEVEELRRAVAQLVEQLAASLSHAQSFAAQAAHELRTPLASVAGELDLLAEAGVPSASRARVQVEGLIQLVQRLLAIATPGGLHHRDGIALDWADLVDDVIAALPPDGRARVRVAVGDDVLVRGDEGLLRAMLRNAVENALKFSTGTVSIRASQQGDEVRVEVVDDGPGVPAHERERVFDAFYRTGTARASKPGHGLGMALIAHVARAHGGHAELLDAPRGAHLRVTMPRWSASGPTSPR